MNLREITKKFFKSKLISNFSYLTLLQLSSVLLPLIIYPFLLIKLGGNTYGKIIYASALNAYLLVLVNYGFDISIIKRIAENKHNKENLLVIFMNTMWSKLFLFIISFILLFIGMYTIPFIRENKVLCLFSTFVTLGELFFPKWFFLGIEELKYSTITVVISKLISVSLLFLIIKNEEDYLWVPVLMGLGTIIGSIYSMKFAFKKLFLERKYTLKDFRPNLDEIRGLIKQGFSFFLSRGFVVVREKAGILIIGQLFGYIEVSVFDLVQKIIKVLTIPIDMVNTVIFPRVAKTRQLKYVLNGVITTLGYSILCYLVIIFFPYNYFAEEFNDGQMLILFKTLMAIFGIGLILQVFIYFSGNTVLVVFGFNKEFNFTVILGGVVYLLLLLLGYIWTISIEWIGYITLISYLFIIILRVFYIYKHQLLNGAQKTI